MPETEQIVADEARRRPLLAVASAASGLAFMGSGILTLSVFSDRPPVRLVDALGERLGPGEPTLKIEQTLFYDENGLALVALGVLAAVAAALVGYVLSALFRAIRARDHSTRRAAIIATIIGSVGVAVGAVVSSVVRYVEAADFAGSSERTAEGARDVTEGAAYLISTAFQAYFGALALGLGIGLIGYHAMRVGLLSRFMGVLGMIAGVSAALPIFPVPIIQALWLVGLGVVLLGNSPGGLPPAWASGVATPWPSQQELREQRERQAAGRPPDPAEEGVSRPKRGLLPKARAKAAAPPPEPAPPAATAKPHSSSKKRKRKRR